MCLLPRMMNGPILMAHLILFAARTTRADFLCDHIFPSVGFLIFRDSGIFFNE